MTTPFLPRRKPIAPVAACVAFTLSPEQQRFAPPVVDTERLNLRIPYAGYPRSFNAAFQPATLAHRHDYPVFVGWQEIRWNWIKPKETR